MTSTTTPPTSATPKPAAAAAAPAAPAQAVAPKAPQTGEPKTAGAPAAPAAASAAPAKPAAAVPQLGDDAEDADGGVPALGVDDPAAEDAAPKDGDADAPEGDEQAPIDYQFEAPEGQPAYREPMVDAYKEVLQKHRVDAAVAKDILDTMVPVLRADVDAQIKASIEAQTTQWRAELEQRHGTKLGDVMRLANRALAKGASPQLTNFLRNSALAANADFIDLLAFFGGRITNDRSLKSTTPPAHRDTGTAEERSARAYEREAEAERKQRGN